MSIEETFIVFIFIIVGLLIIIIPFLLYTTLKKGFRNEKNISELNKNEGEENEKNI